MATLAQSVGVLARSRIERCLFTAFELNLTLDISDISVLDHWVLSGSCLCKALFGPLSVF